MATPKKDKKPEPAGYCTTAVLANLFDITAQWVGELTRNGILRKHETEVGPRYNVVEATRSYVKYLREKAAGRSEKEDAASEKEQQKLAAEVRIKEAKAEYAELELQELQGTMHRSDDVESMTEQLVYTIRSMMVALPGRLAVDVAGVMTAAEASVIIRREVNAILDELSNFKYDPAAYAKLVNERQKWTDADEDIQ
jgi:phage terminase Nu1 subunit (DNA packaging protein)